MVSHESSVQLRHTIQVSPGDAESKKFEADNTSKLHEGWALLPRLFHFWDADGSGQIDKKEILVAIEKFCDLCGVDFDSKRILQLFAEVDDNGDGVLDEREFAAFMSRLSFRMKIPMDVFVKRVSSLLGKKQYLYPIPQGPKSRLSWMQVPKNHRASRQSWVEMKVIAEQLHASKPTAFEQLRINLAMRKYHSHGNKNCRKKATATLELWHFIQNVLLLKKGTEEDPRSKDDMSGVRHNSRGLKRRGSVGSIARRRASTGSVRTISGEDGDGEHLLGQRQLSSFNPFDLSDRHEQVRDESLTS